MDHPWLLPLWIALGAIPGALCRHYLIIWFAETMGTDFPFGTLFVNVSGSVFMGFCSTLIDENISWLNGLVTMGFIASYTTFSTYALDMSKLWGQRRYAPALVYFLGSPVAGWVGLELGIFLANWSSFPQG
ncbi:fluoride efflux transporter CrcB [Synechococcus sp. C9]|jgi:CrcB protein|uniref:fluoride efflux transporter CrcB n=1 Tax=Synechococcus sp. C9 TaxID=102119 RepID=UPI001FF13FC5|nr:fluoride efflux transporter CrcB [Synechococcus sp. C9]